MRKKLKEIGKEERHTFTATFVRFGYKNDFGYIKRTLLFKDIKDIDDNILTNHLWFNLTKGFEELNLIEDDVVEFDARVDSYVKGYKGYDILKQIECPLELDYKLSRPTHIKKII